MTNETQTASSCCSTSSPNTAVDSNGRDSLLAGSNEDMTTCPVMAGNPVSKKAAEAAGLYRYYDGQRYHFCCAGCGSAFDSNPSKYATSMA